MNTWPLAIALKFVFGAAKYQYEVNGFTAVVEFVPANACLERKILSFPTQTAGRVPALNLGDFVTLMITVSVTLQVKFGETFLINKPLATGVGVKLIGKPFGLD